MCTFALGAGEESRQQAYAGPCLVGSVWSLYITLCSSLFSVAVLKCSDAKQRGREDLFNSLFQITVHYSKKGTVTGV